MKINPILARKEILELIQICKDSPGNREIITEALIKCNNILNQLEKDSPVIENLAMLVIEVWKESLPILTKDEFKEVVKTAIHSDPEMAIQVMLENMTHEQREEFEKRCQKEMERRRPKLVKKDESDI